MQDQRVSLNIATASTRRQIVLSHKYRTSLISNVVTGKLDVREAAATLPELGTSGADNALSDNMAGVDRELEQMVQSNESVARGEQ